MRPMAPVDLRRRCTRRLGSLESARSSGTPSKGEGGGSVSYGVTQALMDPSSRVAMAA